MPKPLFSKVLVANRGEIACRVFRTCRRLGIGTVAVYSEPDKNSKHVKMADEAVCIGPAAPLESYLHIPRVLDAVKSTKAEAVHPGYGFLSENFRFVAALEEAGVKFCGPSVSAMHAMGDKIESKRLARSLGVPVVPGSEGEVENEEQLLKVIKEVIGYPVMLKPSAGGGGKGMRVARSDKEAVEAYRLSKAEAKTSFGDDRMLVERFVDAPRHIEVQLIADGAGNVVALPERECSLQRRNQKVLEEAPSPFVDVAMRGRMQDCARRLAHHVKYSSAGTVEFMVDARDASFFFLEMNTRLQVEHPITEMVTGVDLVEQMLRVAAGLPLSDSCGGGVPNANVQPRGHATEARVYAEDPANNYLPSTGRLRRYVEPQGHGVRVDTGITEGSQVSVFYDPMIAKVCTWGKDRADSILRMRHALASTVVVGVRNNLALLCDVLTHKRYQSGELTTKYLQEEYPNGFKPRELPEAKYHRGLAAGAVRVLEELRLGGGRADATALYVPGSDGEMGVTCGDLGATTWKLKAANVVGEATFTVTPAGGEALELRVSALPGGVVRFSASALPAAAEAGAGGCEWVAAHTGAAGPHTTLIYNGAATPVLTASAAEAAALKFMKPPKAAAVTPGVRAPMPGLVVDVLVSEGQSVTIGDPIVVLEAMKMRNVLRAEMAAKISKITCKLRDAVEEDALLVEMKPL